MIIHEGSNGGARFIDLVDELPVKPRIKIKRERTTNCMKLKFARSIKSRKGSKFTTKVLAKIQMSGVTVFTFYASTSS